jgi:hypothetical protein
LWFLSPPKTMAFGDPASILHGLIDYLEWGR